MAAAFLVVVAGSAPAQTALDLPVLQDGEIASRAIRGVELRAYRTAIAPKRDGVLDDAARDRQPVPAEQWVLYNPLRGEPAQQHTRLDRARTCLIREDCGRSRRVGSAGGVNVRAAADVPAQHFRP